jgi:hypothetical protein
MSDPRNAAMTQHIENQHRIEMKEQLALVLLELAEVKALLTALQAKKPAKE